MDVMYPNGCGLDVHKQTVVACLLWRDECGKRQKEIRTFATLTADLLQLADWLDAHGCTHVAMESTGVYWKPIYNLLEGNFELLLVNARHLKAVPGRKTDVRDCQWIAELLEHGLLKRSFVPPVEIRQLRDWTRRRRTLKRARVDEVNRLQKILEDANIKLGDVASDVMGKSARAMLAAIVRGVDDPAQLAQLTFGALRKKREALQAALTGRVTDHHRRLLREVLDHIDYLERAMARATEEIERLCAPFREALEHMDTTVGVNAHAAQDIIAEIGADMSVFPTAAHLASWAGACPGNHESAGKRKSGKCRKGDPWLGAVLTECAWAASHSKGTYLSALYHRLAPRRGNKRAVKAVAHSQLTAIYFMLKYQVAYHELGPGHFDQLNAARITRHHVRRLEQLGHRVTLEPLAQAA